MAYGASGFSLINPVGASAAGLNDLHSVRKTVAIVFTFEKCVLTAKNETISTMLSIQISRKYCLLDVTKESDIYIKFSESIGPLN